MTTRSASRRGAEGSTGPPPPAVAGGWGDSAGPVPVQSASSAGTRRRAVSRARERRDDVGQLAGEDGGQRLQRVADLVGQPAQCLPCLVALPVEVGDLALSGLCRRSGDRRLLLPLPSHLRRIP